MRQNSDLITAVQTLTVTTVYTAAGTNFPSSSSYHSTKAQSPQSAELAGVTVPQPQTAHTHAYTHTHTCIWTHTHAYAHTGSIEAGCGGTRIAFIALLLFHDIVNAVSSLLYLWPSVWFRRSSITSAAVSADMFLLPKTAACWFD